VETGEKKKEKRERVRFQKKKKGKTVDQHQSSGFIGGKGRIEGILLKRKQKFPLSNFQRKEVRKRGKKRKKKKKDGFTQGARALGKRKMRRCPRPYMQTQRRGQAVKEKMGGKKRTVGRADYIAPLRGGKELNNQHFNYK